MAETGGDITGGCLCGAVRFRSTAEPIVTRMCWCRLCQALGAGSGTVNACFASETVTFEGEMGDYSGLSDSGNVMHRRFCKACGTPITSEAESRPHLVFIRAGAFDDPNRAEPSAIIWTSMAPHWACFDVDLPKFPAQVPPAA